MRGWLLLPILLPLSLGAQVTATLRGRVQDPTGANVGGAAVTIENALTGYAETARTPEDGAFSVSNIPFQE